jgi:hypothetical protein
MDGPCLGDAGRDRRTATKSAGVAVRGEARRRAVSSTAFEASTMMGKCQRRAPRASMATGPRDPDRE